MRGILLLAGLLAAAVTAECLVRALCIVPALADIRLNHYAWTAVSPNRYDAGSDLAGLRPDYHAASRACGRALHYDTAPAPNPDWGYRINGEPHDSGPVYGLILGDSFTEGRHVDNSRTFTSRLSALSGRRFLNAGRVTAVGGPTSHLEYLAASRLLELRPKIVMLQLNPTDVADELRLAARRADAHRESPPSGTAATAYPWLLRNSALAFHFYHAYRARPFAPKPAGDPAAGHARIKAAIDELLTLGRRRGFQVLVLVDDVTALKAEAAYAKERGVLLDAGVGDGAKHVRYDGHLNEAGHDEVAQRIWARIREGDRLSRTPR